MTIEGKAIKLIGLVGLMVGMTATMRYARMPDVKDAGLIREQAQQIEIYNGISPQEQLDKALEAINVVKVENPSQAYELEALEKAVLEAKTQSPELQQAGALDERMQQVAEELDLYLLQKTKDSRLLAIGAIGNLAGLGIYGVGCLLDYENEEEY